MSHSEITFKFKKQCLTMMRSSSAAASSNNNDQEALWMSTLQVASTSWTAFDWNARLSQLDQAAQQAMQQKEQSLVARKQLAETTKQFKKSVKAEGNSEFAKECKSTIKQYQTEIDALTKRSKHSEVAFMGIHQALVEVPDPSSLLQTAYEQIQSQKNQLSQLLKTVEEVNREMSNMELNHEKELQNVRAENKSQEKASSSAANNMSKQEREELVQLRREVAEYEVEFRSLKNQDITIRKLEAKIQELQTAGEEQLKLQLEKAQLDLQETEGRRAAEALEREAAMERKVESLELLLKAERAGREATQAHLLQQDEGLGEREAAWEAQRRILVDDAERLRVTLHEAVRERDALRLKVAAVEGGSGGDAGVGPTPPPSGSVSMADLINERKAYEAEVCKSDWGCGVLIIIFVRNAVWQ